MAHLEEENVAPETKIKKNRRVLEVKNIRSENQQTFERTVVRQAGKTDHEHGFIEQREQVHPQFQNYDFCFYRTKKKRKICMLS